MQYPYERFLRYLVSRKASVDGALERIGLPRVGDLWVPTTRALFRRSAPPQVVRYLDGPGDRLVFKDGFLDWARTEEIGAFWEQDSAFLTVDPDPSFALAGDLFFNPLRRATLGMLLLCGFKASDVCRTMQQLFELPLSEHVLGLYEANYWDHRRAWKAFWTDVVPKFSPDERQYYAVGLRWPRPQLHEVWHWLGLQTDEDPTAALTEIMVHALGEFRAEKRSPNPNEERLLRNAALVERTADKLRRANKGALKNAPPGQELAKKLALFSVVPQKVTHPTLAELTGEVSVPVPRTPERG